MESTYPKQLQGNRAKEVYDDITNRYPSADETLVINYANTVEKMENVQETIFNKPYYNKAGVVIANPAYKTLETYTRLFLQLAKAIGIGKETKKEKNGPKLLAFNKAVS